MKETISKTLFCTKCKEYKPEKSFDKDKRRKTGRAWQCKECIRTYHLKIRRERSINSKKKVYHTFYPVYRTMLDRCYNRNNKNYYLYGGRGIKICNKWKNDFWSFVNDMVNGYEKGKSIDRINNDGNYEPSNCRWATPYEQRKNSRYPGNSIENCISIRNNNGKKRYIAAKNYKGKQFYRKFNTISEARAYIDGLLTIINMEKENE